MSPMVAVPGARAVVAGHCVWAKSHGRVGTIAVSKPRGDMSNRSAKSKSTVGFHSGGVLQTPSARTRVAGHRRTSVLTCVCRAFLGGGSGVAGEDGDTAAVPQRPKSKLADLDDADIVEISPKTEIESTSTSSPKRLGKTFSASVLGASLLLAVASLLPVGTPHAPSHANAGTSLVGEISSNETGVSKKEKADSVKKNQNSLNSHFTLYKEYTPTEIFTYKVQKVFALPLIGKVLCLFILTVPIVFVGAVAYKVVDALGGGGASDSDGDEADGDDDGSFKDNLKNAYFNLFDIPGADATTDKSLWSGIVTQTIVFTGFFVFAVIIGIISDEIATKVEEVKTGNNKVIETDHTVVVNWNSQLVPLLKQMAVAKSERAGTFDKPVVLLADIDKETMDDLVANALEDSPPLEVVTRRGNPFDADDLAKVNAYRARRVIILHPHEKDVGMLGYGGDGSLNGALLPGDSLQKQQREEALKATVVLNLLADRGRESFPDVIVQMPYRLPEKQDLVGHALRLTTGNMHVSDRPSDELLHGETFRVMDAQRPYVQVHGSENTGKISAFAAFQPGTSRIFEELFKQSEDTPEFYLSHAPQFVGKTFGEAWRMLPNATLCGLSHVDGSVSLAPRDDIVIKPTDEVVMLSETSTVSVANANDVAGVPNRGSQKHYMRLMPDSQKGPVKLLFAGWNPETKTAAALALTMAPHGSEITVLSTDGNSQSAGSASTLRSSKNCKLRVVKGTPTAYADLEKARVFEMDAVIVMPDFSQAKSKSEEDAGVLATILQTRAVCFDHAELKKLAKPKQPHVVATLNTESARSIVELMGRVGETEVSPDVIMSDEIVGGALLQVAANPKLAGLFDALLATEGHEMYLRDSQAFGGGDSRVPLDDGTEPPGVTWGTICERARERDELALGVMRENGEFTISPSKNERFVFRLGDRVVVLADEL